MPLRFLHLLAHLRPHWSCAAGWLLLAPWPDADVRSRSQHMAHPLGPDGLDPRPNQLRTASADAGPATVTGHGPPEFGRQGAKLRTVQISPCTLRNKSTFLPWTSLTFLLYDGVLSASALRWACARWACALVQRRRRKRGNRLDAGVARLAPSEGARGCRRAAPRRAIARAPPWQQAQEGRRIGQPTLLARAERTPQTAPQRAFDPAAYAPCG